jgi:predicted amidohydrolase
LAEDDLRVAGIQSELAWEAPEANRRALRPRIEQAAAAGARLVALPEMWPTGFSMRPEVVAEPEGGESERFLAETARACGAAVCGSIAQRSPGAARARNVFVAALPDGSVHRYAKIHPFTYGGEAEHYEAGDALSPFRWEGARVTPLVCYDLRFPELWAAAAPSTDLFVVVANWPEARAAHWRALLVARAIETQAWVLGVNRVGEGGGLRYLGESALVSPLGEIAGDGFGRAGEARTVTGEVSAAAVADVRARFPFLADRRPDVYRHVRGEG